MPGIIVDIPVFHVLRGVAWSRHRHQLITGTDTRTRRLEVANGTLRLDREIDPDILLTAVHQHDDACKHSGLIKDDVKRRLSKVTVGNRSIVVKEFRRVFSIGWLSPDQRSWLGSQRLQGSCPCLGWLRKYQPRCGYLFFEDAGNDELTFSSGTRISPNAAELLAAAGRIIARLHALNVYHADCKASNFVYGKQTTGRFRLTLIDCDDIRVFYKLPVQRKERNLAQFLGIHWRITDLDVRLALAKAFLDGYQREAELTSAQLQASFPGILKYANKIYPDHAERMAALLDKLKRSYNSPGRQESV